MKVHHFMILFFLLCMGCHKNSNPMPSDSNDHTDDMDTISYTISCTNESFNAGAIQCTPTLLSSNLDIASWNIEHFPIHTSTIATVAESIEHLNLDVIAVQEIDEIDAFYDLLNLLNGYEGTVVDVRGGIELGYLYKSDEINLVSPAIKLFEGQTSPFPREPIEINLTHTNGLTVKLINIHLKCCDGSEERRTEASRVLKTYIDDNYPNDEVIVLGDWNEDFGAGSSFTNFLEDSDNYTFSDLPIFLTQPNNYSYPCNGASYCPSHIDHILISNELCDNLVAVNTIRLDDCVESYLTNVSDHRPVMISLKGDD